MSRRKDISASHANLTVAEARLRAKQESKVFELGVPACPEQYIYNNKKLYAIWKQNVERLCTARKLAFSDGEALIEFCKAQLNDQQVVMKAIFDATWAHREPFPDPNPPSTEFSLHDFIASVRAERDSFQQRLTPGETVTQDSTGQPYTWPETDSATVARRYAADVLEGKIVSGELMSRAATRFLADLEGGQSRGIFFDPLAAGHIVQFAEVFCDLTLLPWQVFVLANIFGFKKPTGARRFTEAWISCAKKNGKTRLASCIALFGLVADCERYPDVFSAATKKEQSRIVWRDAKRAVQDNPELAAHVKRWSGALQVTETDGSFTPLSSDEKSMDGLRPHVIIADEVAFWSDRDQWDKLQKGLVSRVSPLVFAVTTSGSSKNCFAFGKFDLCEKILRGIFADDTTFAAIFSIDKGDDSLKDEACWHKANPSLDVLLKVEHLRKTRDEVLQAPSGMNSWLQYHCNIWPEVALQRAGSVPAVKWDLCAGFDLIGTKNPLDATLKFLALNSDTPCFLGVDVGLTSDLTAVAMLFPKARFSEGAVPIKRPVVIVQGFMPEAGLLEKERAWQVPLSAWAREGWLELLPGDLTDPREIKKFIRELHIKLAVREVGFDPWQFSVAAAELNESGIGCVGVPQTAKELTAPCRELIAAVQNKELVHFGNPYLAWNASNVVLVESEKHSGIKPEKLRSAEKIDAISALVNGWHRMLAAPPPSPYLERGIVFI